MSNTSTLINKEEIIDDFVELFYQIKNRYINCSKEGVFYRYIYPKWSIIYDDLFKSKYIEKILFNIICLPNKFIDQDEDTCIRMLFHNTNEQEINKIKSYYQKIKSCKSYVEEVLCDIHNNPIIIQKIKEVFYQYKPTFVNKLNSLPNIIGFVDGVYDLKIMKYRRAKPNDYITNTLPFEYDANCMNIIFNQCKRYFTNE
jgi:hypothetical protein